MLKQIVIAVVILIFGVGLGLVVLKTGPKLEAKAPEAIAPLVRVIKVSPRTIELVSRTHGTVKPRTESDVVPEVSGRIVSISDAMVSGGFFKQGDVLFSIEAIDYEEALEQAKAGLARAQSDLSNARKAHSRQIDLAKRQSTSAAQKDDALNRLSIAEATSNEAKARLSRAKRDLKRTRILAPYDGRVRAERIDVGQFVNRGTMVATIYATDYAEVKLPVLDEELAYLGLDLLREQGVSGHRPKVVLSAMFAGRTQTWQGEIVRTEGEIDPTSRMVSLVASVEAPYSTVGDQAPLAVGLFVNAEISGRKEDQLVVLPRSALRTASSVAVVDASNILQFREVEVLRIVNDLVYVKAGLTAGEFVSVSNATNSLDGMLVRPLTETLGANP